MALYKKLTERFETSEKEPESMLWGNGTTDKRFDIAGNVFVDPTDQQKAGKIDFLHPIFLTHDVDYMFKYVKSHITKDYGVDSSQKARHAELQAAHGLIVFVKLKSGVQLFDFTDKEDFKKVFGEDDGQAIALVFKDAEPYFAFNSSVTNAYKQYEPIEFSIAKRMAVYLAVDKKWKDDDKKEPIQSFFTAKNQSFIQIFTKANESLFDITITEDMYLELLDFYKKTLVGAELRKSQTGRDQLVKWGQIWKIFPDSLDSNQLARLNGYFKLLKFSIQYRNLLNDPEWFPPDVYQKVLDNTDPKKRVGFIDLLQACLYIAIDQAGFSGFWCPEYLGKKTVDLSNDYPSIAIFDPSVIEKYKSYSFSEIQEVLSYMSRQGQTDTNLLLYNLKTGIANKRKADDEKRKAAAEIQARKDNGEYYVDDDYLQQLWEAIGRNNKLWQVLHVKIMEKFGEWIKSSPNEVAEKVKKQISEIRRKHQEEELQAIEKRLDPDNIKNLSVFQIENLRLRQRVLKRELNLQ